MNFAAGFIWFAYAFTADLNECLRELNVDIGLQIEKPAVAKQIQLIKKIASIVRFHSKTTKYSIFCCSPIYLKRIIFSHIFWKLV